MVGVVNLQAQYGISATANSNQVTQWVDAQRRHLGRAHGRQPQPDQGDSRRGGGAQREDRARRRDGRMQFHDERPRLPVCAPGPAAASASPAPTVDLSPGDANWARYRYRVFETIIPLRNVIWSKDTL